MSVLLLFILLIAVLLCAVLFYAAWHSSGNINEPPKKNTVPKTNIKRPPPTR